MRTQDRPSGRRSRGGSRRRSDRSDNPPPAPAKQTFWQKIVALFSGTSATKPAANGHRRPARDDREGRSDRFEKSERGERPGREEPRREVRKPEIVEVSSPKLYVGNLSFDASESDLFDLFNGVGKVQSAEIVSHKYTQKSKGFAFVVMTSIEEAKRAVSELHDKDFMDRKLVVSGAKTSETRSGGDGYGSAE